MIGRADSGSGAPRVEQDKDKIKIEFTVHRMRGFVRKARPKYYEVWNEDGVAIAKSPQLGPNDLISSPDLPDDTFSFT